MANQKNKFNTVYLETLKQEAINRYPKGTKVVCLSDNKVDIVESFDEVWVDGIVWMEGERTGSIKVYDPNTGEWAKIFDDSEPNSKSHTFPRRMKCSIDNETNTWYDCFVLSNYHGKYQAILWQNRWELHKYGEAIVEIFDKAVDFDFKRIDDIKNQIKQLEKELIELNKH